MGFEEIQLSQSYRIPTGFVERTEGEKREASTTCSPLTKNYEVHQGGHLGHKSIKSQTFHSTADGVLFNCDRHRFLKGFVS